MIQRETYVNWLIQHRGNGLIKVISGVRRSGKSTLFELYKEYLLSLGVKEKQIIHLNFESLEHYELRDFLKLNEYLIKATKKTKTYPHFFVFLDEIQIVDKFEEVVNSINLQRHIDVYITGSNAYFMSGELATFLTGRYVELEILPLSFKEFYSQFSYLPRREAYEQYRKSALPYLVNVEDEMERMYYIRSAYNDVALKDIVARYKITEINLLERVLRFLVSVIGSEVSVNKITNTLKSHKMSVSNNTIEKYVDAFVDGLILYRAPRYDIKGRKLLERLEKYYVVDLGFREFLLPDAKEDEGHILENIVFLELKRRYKAVYIGKNGALEVDFVCLDEKNNPHYYQVAFQTIEEQTLARELRSLENIKDNHPKYLLTLEGTHRTSNFQGIVKKNVLEWFLEE